MCSDRAVGTGGGRALPVRRGSRQRNTGLLWLGQELGEAGLAYGRARWRRTGRWQPRPPGRRWRIADRLLGIVDRPLGVAEWPPEDACSPRRLGRGPDPGRADADGRAHSHEGGQIVPGDPLPACRRDQLPRITRSRQGDCLIATSDPGPPPAGPRLSSDPGGVASQLARIVRSEHQRSHHAPHPPDPPRPDHHRPAGPWSQHALITTPAEHHHRLHRAPGRPPPRCCATARLVM
jgi:hypothetical protein